MQRIEVSIGGQKHGFRASYCVMAKALDSDFWFVVTLGGSYDCHCFIEERKKDAEDEYEYKKVKLD